jgi:carbohydrate kinase (thermoresistant glucokinase family)
MGVSGCGKTSIGRLVSELLDIPFYDADDYHSDGNILKMTHGIPLNDADRLPWLYNLNRVISDNKESSSCILACSSLNDKYRKILSMDNNVIFIFLDISYDLANQRLLNRRNHFMSRNLLKNQFTTLEITADCLIVDARKTVEEICYCVVNLIKKYAFK